MRTVLVFEDDVRFSPNAAQELSLSLRELQELEWQLLYLGGFRREAPRSVQGCRNLMAPTVITCTHAIAYHHSVYDAILGAVPDNAPDVALWLPSIMQSISFTLFSCQLRVSDVARDRDSGHYSGRGGRPFIRRINSRANKRQRLKIGVRLTKKEALMLRSIGMPELLVILAIALLLFGPKNSGAG